MPGNVLVDTSVAIDLFNGDEAVGNRLKNSDEALLSCIRVGELYYGAHCSARPDDERRRIDEFLAASATLDCILLNRDAHFSVIESLLIGACR